MADEENQQLPAGQNSTGAGSRPPYDECLINESHPGFVSAHLIRLLSGVQHAGGDRAMIVVLDLNIMAPWRGVRPHRKFKEAEAVFQFTPKDDKHAPPKVLDLWPKAARLSCKYYSPVAGLEMRFAGSMTSIVADKAQNVATFRLKELDPNDQAGAQANLQMAVLLRLPPSTDDFNIKTSVHLQALGILSAQAKSEKVDELLSQDHLVEFRSILHGWIDWACGPTDVSHRDRGLSRLITYGEVKDRGSSRNSKINKDNLQSADLRFAAGYELYEDTNNTYSPDETWYGCVEGVKQKNQSDLLVDLGTTKPP